MAAGFDRRAFLGRGVSAAAVGGAALFLAACGQAAPQASGATTASGKLREVIDRKKLIVGTGTGNPPWHFDDAGVLSGFDIDMARIVAAGLFNDSNAVEFVQEASDQRLPNLQANKVDIVFQFMTANATRAQQINFTIPYYREGIGLLLGTAPKFADYAALQAGGAAVRVSILQNPDAKARISAILPQAQVVELDSQANVIAAVGAGQADAAAVDQSTVRWLTVTEPGKYSDSGFGFEPQTYAAGVRQGDETWLRFVDQALHEAMTGVAFGSYAASFKKWFGVDLPTPKIGFPVEFA